MGMRSNIGGEIVQVEGGHIVRSTGRKDRHSKVYTAKGPRDRRVRLSAHTAIEFYDVQDRLGYDRPSKAVDWLIKKAKSSIDKLSELPPWYPSSDRVETTAQDDDDDDDDDEDNNKNAAAGSSHHHDMANSNNIAEQSESNNVYNFHHSAFISAQQIETDPIANFFPTTSTNSSINFQNYPYDIISRTNNNPTEGNILGLSLHSFHQAGGGGANQAPSSNEHHQSTFFAGGSPDVVGGFEGNHHYQKIVAWNTEEAASSSMDNMNRVGGFMVNLQPFLGGHQSGTLQSSPSNLFSPSLRPWSDINLMNSSNSSEHHHMSQQQIHQASIFGSRFLSDGLARFCIPARTQGEEENLGHGVASNNSPSSASHNSHH